MWSQEELTTNWENLGKSKQDQARQLKNSESRDKTHKKHDETKNIYVSGTKKIKSGSEKTKLQLSTKQQNNSSK